MRDRSPRRFLPLLASIVLAAPAAASTSEPASDAAPTFAEDIAPIIFQNCSSCHRPGEAAPFPLLDYADVKKRGRMIQLVTQTRYMPPWKPEPGFGHFRDSRYLETEDVELIRRWVETGMEQGDPKKTPSLPEFEDGWQLGKPDLVVTMDAPYEVAPDGPDIYRNFVLPLPLEEDEWVTAVEVRPSARSVVHHVLFFLDDSGAARKYDERDPGPGFDGLVFDGTGNLGGWAVGGVPRHLPMNLARPLRKGTDLVIQTHFHPSGKVEMEQTTIGIYFSKEPPQRTYMEFQVPPEYGQYSGIDIPAGEANYVVHDRVEVPVDVELVDVGGHAHYICTKMVGRARNVTSRIPSSPSSHCVESHSGAIVTRS